MLERRAYVHEIKELLKKEKPDLNGAINKDGDKPIHVAIEVGDEELLEQIIKAGADINVPNKQGTTPLGLCYDLKQEAMLNLLFDAGAKHLLNKENQTLLHMVCPAEDRMTIEKIIAKGADVNAVDEEGNTPIHLAATYGNLDAVLLLLKANVRLDVQNNDGMSALELALDNGHDLVVASILNKQIERALDVNEVLVNNGQTALHIAAAINNPDLIDYLILNGASLDVKDLDGYYPIEYAVMFGNVECAELLLNANQFDLNMIVDIDHNTLLHKVVETDNTEMFKVLLNAGIDPFQPNNDDKSACDLAIQSGNIDMIKLVMQVMPNADSAINQAKDTLLTAAIKAGKLQLVEMLLDSGCKPDQYFSSNPPILIAASQGNLEIVVTLLKHGADVDTSNQDNITALHRAAESNHEDILTLLLNSGADVNAVDSDGATPLHYAATNGSYDAADALVSSNNIKIDAKDSHGETALHYAYEGEDSEMLEILLGAKADINATDDKGKSILHYAVVNAVKENDMLSVKALIHEGANGNLADKTGKTPLQIAVEANIPNVTSIFHKIKIAPETAHEIDDYVFYTLNQKKDVTKDKDILAEKISNFRAKFIGELTSVKNPISQD